MFKHLKLLIFCALLISVTQVVAQRTYAGSSVLATGNWYQFSVGDAGVYKLDVAFLNSLGITGSISSSSIRIFGNGGGMLLEDNSALPQDDLIENAIQIVDGGDGVLSGSDHILLYAPGPHQWTKDSVNKRFTHHKNLYSNRSFYFITLSGNGLRVPLQPVGPGSGTLVSSYDIRFFHELDTVNFLNSGKQWYGEEFSNAPGRSLSRDFLLPFDDLLLQPASLRTNVAARSVNSPSRFDVRLNNQLVQQLNVTQISTALYDLFGQSAEASTAIAMTAPIAQLSFNYVQGSFNSQGWLNWFEFFARRPLSILGDKQLDFRDWNSVGNSPSRFVVIGASASTKVWDVTDPLRPVQMNTTLAGNQLSFNNESERLREYISFSSQFFLPQGHGRVTNQNLHQTTEKDYIIVTHPQFLSQAERLAEFHFQRSGLRAVIATTTQVFNEFSSGTPDPTAIRDYAKMYHDRYQANWDQSGKYLLLLGRASFDYKNRISSNTNLVPGYQSINSLDPLATYTSDDFFGFLEDHENINSGLVINELDIGIGRIPARNIEEARSFVDKVMDYHSEEAFGAWRNQMNFVADDEDFNLHLQDAEVLTATVNNQAPDFNLQKIYLDAFQQESGSSGGRYPQANAMINSNIFNGTLLWNYSGHGGPLRLAEEVVIDQSIVNSWNNRYRLPLFITATCDFAPYDNPFINSLGENLLVRPRSGAIALMTTTRVVFAFSNRIMNDNYLRLALSPDPNGRYKTLGEAVMAAKNFTYLNSGDINNNRKFALLGDPAMTIAYPKYRLSATKLNGVDISSAADTISAGEMVILEGEVNDQAGNLLSQFNGRATVSLFDKPQSITTLANDASSQPVSFQTRENSLFKGKATVTNGKFQFQFRLPKDINYQFGNGKISLYAEDGTSDGNGVSNNVIIGGISNAVVNDNVGPEIKGWLNDKKFVNGSISNSRPVLILELLDSSGINTGGSGIDHDIVATLDGDNNNYYVLNNFFETELDSYQKGSLRFQLPELEPGSHSLKIKAWDVMNNSSEFILDFTVVNESELRIDHVLNYPNPFTTNTAFWFEHNQPLNDLNVKVEVFTVTGKLIKSLAQTINTPGNRSIEVTWDGKDDFGNRIGQGVYLYHLQVRAPNGKTANKWERLVILGK